MNKLLLTALLLASTHTLASVHTLAIASLPATCVIDHRCDVHGTHDISIFNNSPGPKPYSYVYKLCAYQDGYETDCDYHAQRIYLAPYEQWNNHYESFTHPRFAYEQSYEIRISTEVTGNESDISRNKYTVRVTR